MTGAAPPARRQDEVPQGPVMPALGKLPGVIQALPDAASTAQEDAQVELDRVLSVMEQSEEVAQELPVVPVGAAPLLALGDEMDATEEGRLTAQKRLMLLDDAPLSIKKSKVGADRLPELVMSMTRSSGQ